MQGEGDEERLRLLCWDYYWWSDVGSQELIQPRTHKERQEVSTFVEATFTGNDHTRWPLLAWFSSVTNWHVTVKRGVTNGTKGLAKPFVYLPDQQQPDSESQPDGLLIPCASHDQHEARWKKTKPWVALGRAVGLCTVTHHGVGEGRAALCLKSIQNPDSMWLPSLRVASLILLKNAPITKRRKLSRLWLCIWGKTKSPLVWLRWCLTRQEEGSSKNFSIDCRMTGQPPYV